MPIDIINLAVKFSYIKNLGNNIVDFFAQAKGLFASFGIIDAIDIIAVAFVVFFVIRVMRETRAMELVKGIIFLIIVYAVVNFLGMGASSFVMRAIFSNILLIVVVLFSPEIRNIFEQMGKGKTSKAIKNLFNSGVAVDVADMKKTIDAVCKSCAEMSDDKVGALIAFENDLLLGDIIESGTILDAKSSKELIENVFYPKSPLHDGAMIIRRDSVYAAGCILPLTKNTDISSSLGTRHRAAIGLSEQTDAIVFVVSEETGNISCAINGVLEQNISTGEMRDILTNQYIPTGSSSDDKVMSKIARRFKR